MIQRYLRMSAPHFNPFKCGITTTTSAVVPTFYFSNSQDNFTLGVVKILSSYCHFSLINLIELCDDENNRPNILPIVYYV